MHYLLPVHNHMEEALLSDLSKYERLKARWEDKQERWEAIEERWEAKKALWAEQEAERPDILAELKARFEARFGDHEDFEERWEARKEKLEARWEKQDARREEKIDRWEEKAEQWEEKAAEWEERLDKYRPEPEPEPEPAPQPQPQLPLTSYTSGLGTYGVTSAFNITVEFVGTWSTELQGAFVAASDYLSTLIVGDVQDVSLADGSVIDDLSITAELLSIDGIGGVLGRAGPTQARNQNSSDDWIPVSGLMEFDRADAEWLSEGGSFTNVVVHEMMHTLGFGTMWGFHGLTSGSIEDGNLAFTGENALAAYIAELESRGLDTFDIRDVPLETHGGPGTAGGHWDEEVFTTELMTGFLDAGATMSLLSVASLEDMGYDTVFDASDPDAAMPQVDEFSFV